MLMSRLNEPLNFYYPISFPVVMINVVLSILVISRVEDNRL